MASADTPGRRHAVILAGGRGVRFWPSSRAHRPKQLLAPLGGPTLLRRTFDRLGDVFPPERIWVLTSRALEDAVARELEEIPADHVVAEPLQRNTAPAIGLAAALLHREDPDAVMGVFPADHHLADAAAWRTLVGRALEAAAGDRLVVLGIRPRWPETGYGYIEFPEGTEPGTSGPLPVVRFREKPDAETARAFVSAGRFYWNSGQFFWKAGTYLEELRDHLPQTRRALDWIAERTGDAFRERLGERYADCDGISVDRGILERSRRVAGFAAPDLGWTDLGSWSALHSLLDKDANGNVSRGPATFRRARGNLVDAPEKHVALLGVDDLVVVETPDAILVCRRAEAQNVGSVVRALEADGLDDLL